MAPWYAVTYRCHARLTPTPVRHSGKNIHRISLNLNILWRGTFNDHRPYPRPFDWLTCHRPSGRLRVEAIHICHTQTVNAINANMAR